MPLSTRAPWPGRVALLIACAPVAFAAFLGLVGNWPATGCGWDGCPGDNLGGSGAAAFPFGIALGVIVIAAVLAVVGRARAGLVGLAIAALIAIAGLVA